MGFWNKVFFTGQWDILFCKNLEALEKNDFLLIKSNCFEWYADPFLLKHKNKFIVFCERKKISKKNGDICCFFIDKKFIKKRKVIAESFHMSFPNVFVENEYIYVIPETSRGNNLFLYTLDDNLSIISKTIIAENVSYVDSVIYTSEKQKYLCTYNEKNSLLFFKIDEMWKLKLAFEFKDVFGKFRPAGNPINNIFYFQDCSYVYGEKIHSMVFKDGCFSPCEDIHLTKINDFCSKNGYSRFHTFNKWGDSFVFDVYREKFNIFKPILCLWRKIHGN